MALQIPTEGFVIDTIILKAFLAFEKKYSPR